MNSPHHFVELISQATDELISQAKIDPHKVLGVGIGVPGIVEHNDCICVFLPIWGWQRVPFGELLKERIPFPLYLDNGAKAMTLAESWFGAGQNVQNLAVILLGTGVGSGILMHGNLYRGATNSAGEWGHTKIVLEGRECRCGSKGCLEAYVGALGIITSLRELAPDSPWLASDDQLAILDNVVAAAEQGNALALQVLSSTANDLGAGIANLINLFNPELIVVGGWAGLRIGKFIMPELNQSVERYTLPPSLAATRIDLCRFGEDAICIGAACLILDQFLSGSQRFGRRSPR